MLVCVVCCVEINLLVCLVLRHMRLLKCVVAPDFIPCSFWIFVYYVYFLLSFRCCSIEVFDYLTSWVWDFLFWLFYYFKYSVNLSSRDTGSHLVLFLWWSSVLYYYRVSWCFYMKRETLAFKSYCQTCSLSAVNILEIEYGSPRPNKTANKSWKVTIHNEKKKAFYYSRAGIFIETTLSGCAEKLQSLW